MMEESLRFLQACQQEDGSFIHYSSCTPNDFHSSRPYSSTFFTSVILHALRNLPDSPGLAALRKKGSNFLLDQKSQNWSFNYWNRNSPEYKRLPYPDDLDDTFYALAALHHTAPGSIDGRVLAHMVSQLAMAEVQVGGPYRTWLISKEAPVVWQDVDVAVNSTIASFLALQGITLPSLIALVENAITAGEITSPYYPTAYPILYSLSGWYTGELQQELARHIRKLRRPEGDWGTPMDTALSITALCNLKQATRDELSPALAYLEASQEQGVWPAQAFCLDPAIAKVSHFAGSETLTTALCLEALHAAAEYQLASDISPSLAHQNTEDAAVWKRIQTRLYAAPPSLAAEATPILDYIRQRDIHHEISSLPKWTLACLTPSHANKVDLSLCIRLGAANIYGWLAYTIYDDFLDNEGKVPLLPVANLALRELTDELGQALPKKSGFPVLFREVLDRLEAANHWEVTTCRFSYHPTTLISELPQPIFGDLHQLAKRSLGHALSSAAILVAAGYPITSPEVTGILTFFTHYLIARQLNDDAHDWEEDIRKGRLNAVSALLLEQARPHLGGQSLEQAMNQLRLHFWETTIQEIGEIIFTHLEAATSALKSNPAIADPDPLLRILAPIHSATTKAVTEQRRTMEFIETYSASGSDH